MIHAERGGASKTLKVVAKVDAPLATMALSTFSDDGAKVAAMMSSPDKPTDVYALMPRREARTLRIDPARSREARRD